MGLVAAEHVDLFVAVHGVPEIQTRTELQVARLKHTFEQQDRPAPAQVAYALGLGQVQQRNAVGAAQTLKDTFDAMTVRIGLDHGPHSRVGCLRAHSVQVVLQGAQVDGGKDGAGHGGKGG